MKCRVEKGVVFKGVAFRELPGGRSRWRLPQSRDRGLQRSTHCGYCVHGTHLLPMDHDCQDVSTPATRCTQPASRRLPYRCRTRRRTATPSSVMGRQQPGHEAVGGVVRHHLLRSTSRRHPTSGAPEPAVDAGSVRVDTRGVSAARGRRHGLQVSFEVRPDDVFLMRAHSIDEWG